MIAPLPFVTWGEDNAPFYCLGFMDGIYHMTRSDEPATQGLYFCPAPQFTNFSLHIFGQDGRQVLYHRGDDNLDSIEFLLLDLLRREVKPHFWRLFPREQVVVPAEHQQQYEQHRSHFCLLLYHFRSMNWMETEMLKKKVPSKFNVAPGSKAPYLDEETQENEEITGAVMARVQDSSRSD